MVKGPYIIKCVYEIRVLIIFGNFIGKLECGLCRLLIKLPVKDFAGGLING